MHADISLPELTEFLIDAKRRTYAGLDDDATVQDTCLAGSMQLEWRQGDWFYRDIYYGMSKFIGLEAVYYEKRPVWAMSYSGGANQGAEIAEAKSIYGFLRSALMEVPREFPVRGPSSYSQSDFAYKMTSQGNLEAFSGLEEVSFQKEIGYRLSFSGGLIR